MALSLFLTHSQPRDTLRILTDSAHASIAITKHHQPKANRALVRAVRKLYYHTLKDRYVDIEWVPAHVGIEGNERADSLADEGARLSDQGRYLRPLQQHRRIQEGHFLALRAAPGQAPIHAQPNKKRRRQNGPDQPPAKRGTAPTSTPQKTTKRRRPVDFDPPPAKRSTQSRLTFTRTHPN